MSEASLLTTDFEPPHFFGMAEHRMTPKCQVAMPAVFRAVCRPEVLEAGFWLRQEEPDHLNLYPQPEFARIRRNMRARLEQMDNADAAAAYLRAWSASTHCLTLDAQGRILLPKAVLKAAGIPGPEVLFLGCDLRIELWDPRVYAARHPEGGDYPRWMQENRRAIVGL